LFGLDVGEAPAATLYWGSLLRSFLFV
jgi:hypothetical protein